MGINLNRVLKLALTPAVVATSTIFAAPTHAATLSFSQVSLELDNFNQISQDVFADTDVGAIAIADDGSVTVDIDFSTIFSADESMVFANSDSQTTTSGEGDRFFGQAQFVSQLIGVFDVGAGQDFAFDFGVSLDLSNSVDSLQSGSVSTSGSASFFLVDNLNQELFSYFDIFGSLNTNLTDSQDNDFLFFQGSDNITVTDSFGQSASGSLQESIQVAFEGSFQQRFNDDKQLTLIAFTTNESCVQEPRAEDACVQVPEPSNILALIFLGGGLGVLSSVVKQVIQFARQPLAKHPINNALIGFRR